jgi:hypothetical protein
MNAAACFTRQVSELTKRVSWASIASLMGGSTLSYSKKLAGGPAPAGPGHPSFAELILAREKDGCHFSGKYWLRAQRSGRILL